MNITWTKELPTKSGFYWIRSFGDEPVVALFLANAKTIHLPIEDGEFEVTPEFMADQDLEFWPVKLEAPR